MRKALSITTTRRRAAVTAVGLTAAAAFAVPGVAWANDAIPNTAPVVVSVPATQTEPATQSEPTVAGCAAAPARVLTPEEVDALIASGELAVDTMVPSTAAVAVDDASATVIRLAELVGQGQTVADLIAQGADALTGPDAAVTLALPAC